LLSAARHRIKSWVRVPDNLARIPLLTRRNPSFKTGILSEI
jgi:hypothetical protein